MLQQAVHCGGVNGLAAMQVCYDGHHIASCQAVLALHACQQACLGACFKCTAAAKPVKNALPHQHM